MLKFSTATLAPSRRLLGAACVLVAAVFALAIGLALSEKTTAIAHLNQFTLAALLVFLCLFILDGAMALRHSQVEVTRNIAGSVAVDRWTEVTLVVHHHHQTPSAVEVFDDINRHITAENLPLNITLEPGKSTTVHYRLKARMRGPMTLGLCHVRALSPLGLWSLQYFSGKEDHIKVYPDFSAITAFTLLAVDNHESQIGIKRKPRRGEGLEFLQLRDYRSGDSLRKIHWKATSRRHKLISKEYQDERDQQIVLLIDSARRMRSKDDTLSHFDHSLNALLLVSYIALRQGDSVSAMSFGNAHRWVAPQKGVGAMKTILNEMYDLQAGNCAPDYVGAAEKLSLLQRKRSLVILVTNSRDEEVEEMLMATKLLSRRHVVLLANIRETAVENTQQMEINDIDDALLYTGMQSYLKRRQEVLQKITSQGIFSVDCFANQLAVRVANSYLEIKRSGVL